MLKNNEVVKRWLSGKSGKGLNFRTDGGNLYSYDLRIGFTAVDEAGEWKKFLLMFVGKNRVSMTTSHHIYRARWGGVVEVDVKEIIDYANYLRKTERAFMSYSILPALKYICNTDEVLVRFVSVYNCIIF